MADTYLTRIERQLQTDARDADVTIGVVVLDNPAGETVSMRAALGAKAGKWQWCLFCRLLDVLVQRGHCAATLDPNAVTPWWVWVRAMLAFASGFTAIGVLIRWAI